MIQSSQEFWKWFKENNKAYLFLNEVTPQVKEILLDEFMKQLHLYCDNLYFEIGGHPDKDQELIITAEGNSDYFEKVEHLISKAPKIDNWIFIAFIPPRDIQFTMEYEDVSLQPQKIWFEPLENSENPTLLGIKVYTANFELIKDSKWLTAATYKMLESILGEKSFALDIGYIDIDQLCDTPEDDGLLKLSDLQEYVSWKKSKQ